VQKCKKRRELALIETEVKWTKFSIIQYFEEEVEI
jgi:hypothetical protein